MDKRKGLMVLLTFSLALNCAFVAVWVYHFFFVRPLLLRREAVPQAEAQRPAGERWRRLEALSLTDEQRHRLTADNEALRQRIEEARRRSHAARERLLDLLTAPESDPEALLALQKEITAQEAQIQRLVIKHLVGMRDVLNPQQRLKLRQMLRPMRPPHHRPMQGQGQGPGPGFPDGPRPHERNKLPQPPEMEGPRSE